MKISFSTAWVNNDISRLDEVLPYIDALEVGAIGDEAFYTYLENLAARKNKPVTSIHAVSGPHKKEKNPDHSPHFTSPDRCLRESALEKIFLTARWAKKLGAKAVILHAGMIEDKTLRENFLIYKERLIQEGESDDLRKIKREIIETRKKLSRDYLETTLAGLRKLCASFPEITFCIETRLHFFEIPLPEEAHYIFEKLRVPNLGYWHDLGHTFILSKLGFVPMEEWQNRFYNRCVGLHIHDVDRNLEDHYPPGFGMLDFPEILNKFSRQSLFTIEINSKHSIDTVLKGVEYIRKMD
ncbi:MAG TPA: sugar phosphate isomerase/epimerase [Spirochaetes bacterium]|nr:sugar phosphate isomerase/epimerase [Spirochaetota bacterium]